ncbi:hypothetical protein RBB50_005650 [Rhinocladiella similis]
MPLPLPEILDSGNLVRYSSSSTCQRWFCRRCGASALNIDKGDGADEWEVATGLLHFIDGRGLDSRLNRVQIWVDDIKGDGGAVGWINQGLLAGMDRHWKGRKSGLVEDKAVQGMLAKGRNLAMDSPSQQLAATCHCRNVAFSISRPDGEALKSTRGKFEAGLDACTSCRIVTGFEVTSWLTVPRHLIRIENTDLNGLLSNKSKLGHYKTSADVSRYFCAECGATIFYYKHGLDTIDIGIGLLNPQDEGMVRVENWLAWQKYPNGVAYQEDAVDKGFIANLAKGIESNEASRAEQGNT